MAVGVPGARYAGRFSVAQPLPRVPVLNDKCFVSLYLLFSK